MNIKHVICIVMILMLLPITAAAQEELPDPGVTPDSPFYGIKRFFENVDLFFTFDSPAKAEKYIRYAGLRLSEAKAMQERGRRDLAENMLEEYDGNLNESRKALKVARKLGLRTANVSERVALATSRHLEVLYRVLDKVPEQAKPAILRAINASSKNIDNVLANAEDRIPENVTKLHLAIAAKRLARAMNKSLENKSAEVDEQVGRYRERVKSALNTVYKMASNKNFTADRVARITQHVENATSKHITVLQRVLQKVPEQAKPAISRAINISRLKVAIKATQRLLNRTAITAKIGSAIKSLNASAIKAKIKNVRKSVISPTAAAA